MSSDAQNSSGPTEAPITESIPKPQKEKKPPTEAQVKQRQAALIKMTEKRKQIAAENKEKKEKVKQAKKVVEDKILKEDVGFVMKSDFDNMRNSFMKEIGELKALYGQQPAAKPKEEKVQKAPERIIERVIERPAPTPSIQQQQRLTGHALLDKVFGFEK